MFLHLSTLPRSDFPVIHGAKKHYQITDLFFVWACALQNSYFFMFSFMAYANLATSPKRLETKLANITRRHFCSLPVFCIEHFFICFLFSEFFPLICLFWQLATTHATGTQIVRAKMTSLDAIFCRGNKSSSRSLARCCCRKQKKSIARASFMDEAAPTNGFTRLRQEEF